MRSARSLHAHAELGTTSAFGELIASPDGSSVASTTSAVEGEGIRYTQTGLAEGVEPLSACFDPSAFQAPPPRAAGWRSSSTSSRR